MPNINIYVPEQTKVRMEAVEDRANWSAIAQRAFGFELARLEAVKEIKTMSDVIERLRASKESFAEQQLQKGREDGANWAKNRAEYNELRNIANFDVVGLDLGSGYEAAAHCFCMVFHPDDQDFPTPDQEELASFLGIDEMALGGLTPEYIEAFVGGAVEVWEEVEDEI